MKISKKLKIKSVESLFTLLSNNISLLESDASLLQFHDNMYEYLNGCMCFEDSYLELATQLYTDIQHNHLLVEKIKNYFKCDDIIFL